MTEFSQVRGGGTVQANTKSVGRASVPVPVPLSHPTVPPLFSQVRGHIRGGGTV
jgi:hypothetical protein